MTPCRKTCVVVISGDAHDFPPKSPKDSSLLQLCVYVCSHLLCWTMLDCYFSLIDLVLDEIILHLNVLSPLRAARPPISLEQYSTHVVLVEQRRFHIIPLFYHEIASPEDISQRVVYPNQLRLRRALRVDLMFPGVT